MITNFDSSTFKYTSAATPQAVSSKYYGNTESYPTRGMTLDFYYGPYSVPDGLYYIFVDDGITTTTKPSVKDDTSEYASIYNIALEEGTVYYTYTGEEYVEHEAGKDFEGDENDYILVYKDRFNYECALSKMYLELGKQYTEGRKVAFIDETGKPIEYTLVKSSNNELEFVNSLMVDIYTVNFYCNDTSVMGGQLQVKTSGMYYTAPKSQFILRPNSEVTKIFMGWIPRINGDNGDLDTSQIYPVNSLIDLSTIYYNDGTDKIVDLCAYYDVPEPATVDFQNGYYTTENGQKVFHSMDVDGANPDYTGYVQVTSKPENWDDEWRSYFIKSGVASPTTFTYMPVNAMAPANMGPIVKIIGAEQESGQEPNNWNNVREVIRNSQHGVDYPLPTNVAIPLEVAATLLEPYIYVYIKKKDGEETNGEKLATREWYKVYNNAIVYQFTPNLSATWNNNLAYYRQMVVDSVSLFNNGEYYTTNYDCLYVSRPYVYSGLTVQIDTKLNSAYSNWFEFDKWEIYALDNDSSIAFRPIDVTGKQPDITLNQATSTVLLDYKKENPNPEGGDVYCDAYVMRAVYREKNVYAYLDLSTNGTNNDQFGEVRITANCNGISQIPVNFKLNKNNVWDSGVSVIPGLEIVTRNNKQQLKVNTCFYDSLNFQIHIDNTVGETDVNYISFFKWTGEIEGKQEEFTLSLEGGHTYTLKAWFVKNDDINAYVTAGKGMLYLPGGGTNYGGWQVKMYGVKYVQTYIDDQGLVQQATFNKSEAVDSPKGYLYEGGVSITNHHNTSYVPTTAMDVIDVIQGGNSNLTMVCDTDNELSSPAQIDISSGSGYCYLKVIPPSGTSSIDFVRWSDNYRDADNTVPMQRLICVDTPGNYSYKAYFTQGYVPLAPIQPDQPDQPADPIDVVLVGGEVGGTNNRNSFGSGSVSGGTYIASAATFDNYEDAEDAAPTTVTYNTTTGTRTWYTYDPNTLADNLATTVGSNYGNTNTTMNVNTTDETASVTETQPFINGVTLTRGGVEDIESDKDLRL